MVTLEDKLKPEVMDKLTKTCICKGISRATVKQAIQNGASTLEEMQQATGAGSGACGGRRCADKIMQLLQDAGGVE